MSSPLRIPLLVAVAILASAGCKDRCASGGKSPKPKLKAEPCRPGPLGKRAKQLLGTWIIDVEPSLKENAEWKGLTGAKLRKVRQELSQMILTFTPKWMEMKGPEKTERLCWEAKRETGSSVVLRNVDDQGKQELIVITWLGPDRLLGQGPERRFYFKRKR